MSNISIENSRDAAERIFEKPSLQGLIKQANGAIDFVNSGGDAKEAYAMFPSRQLYDLKSIVPQSPQGASELVELLLAKGRFRNAREEESQRLSPDGAAIQNDLFGYKPEDALLEDPYLIYQAL